MDAGLVTLILNVLLALFIILGFLWGLGRGVKKSALRIVFFLVFVVIAGLLSSTITNALLGIQINIDGANQSISDYILTQITSNADIKALYDSSEALRTLITQLPVIILNIFVFLALMLVSKFISWIFFAITAKIIFRKKKPTGKFGENVYTVQENQPVILTERKEKKYRLWGGLISAVQAIVFLFLLLLPFNGLTGIVTELANEIEKTDDYATVMNLTDKDYQSTTFGATALALEENEKYTATAQAIRDLMGSEVLEYVEAYQNGLPAIIFGVGGFDDLCFDSLTQTSVGGQKIVLRTEIKNFAHIYNNVYYLTEIDFENVDFKTLNFDKLENAIDALFESGLFRSVGVDLLKYFVNDMITNSDDINSLENAQDIKDLLLIIEDSLNDDNAIENLKSDLLSAVSLIKVFATSGLLDIVNQENPETEEILNLIKTEDGALVSDALDALFQSSTLKNVFVGALNIALEDLEKELKVIINENLGENISPVESVSLDSVKASSLDWNKLKNDLKSMFISIANLFDLTKDIEEDEEFDINSINVSGVLNEVGKLLNTAQNAQFLSSTVNNNNIFHQILNEFNKTKYNKYVDFNELKNISWVNEMDIIADLYNSAKPLFEMLIEEFDTNTATPYSATSATTFENFDYTLLNNNLARLFDSTLAQTFKIEILNLIAHGENEPPAEPSGFGILVEHYTNPQNGYSYVSQMKNEITEIVKAIEILGKTGTLDYILSDEGSLSDVVNALASTQQGQANSQIATALDYLLSTDGARLAFIVALNSFLDSTETTEHPLGNIDKDLSWNGWTAFKIDFENAVDNLIKAIQNVDESLTDASFDDFKVFINDDFAETAIYLGKVLDFTASTQLLVYTENNQEKSIYDELIEMLFGDIFTLEDAKSDKWQANFWTTEFSNLSSVLIKIKDITINENTPDEKPLLDAILDGGDINELLEKANLSDADTTEILNAFLSSKLFKDQVHTAINAVHKELINLVDPDYADELENLEEAIEEQQDDVIDVINNAIKLKDITDIEEISLEEHGEALAGILETMQENTYNTEYENSIFESAYNAITDYITDENTTTENQSINAVIDVINDPANQSLIGDSIENYNWAEIINLASQKLQNS